MGKKSFTTSTQDLLKQAVKTEAKILKQEQKLSEDNKRGVGRPRVYSGKGKTTTSQEGLRDGLTRMTFIVSQVKQDKLKYISYFEGLSIREILDEAIEDYLNKYESQVGKIELN